MPIHNIQTLFATIRVEQVVAYMAFKQWHVTANGDRLDFDRKDAEGETQRLYLPAQQSHPKFRRLLPNLIFSLSVIEQREAIDVANEIVETAIPKPTEPTTAASPAGSHAATSTSQSALPPSQTSNSASIAPPVPSQPAEMLFRNASDRPAVLQTPTQTVHMSAGETVGLDVTSQLGQCVVQFGDRLQISAEQPAGIHLWWPKIEVPAATSISDWVTEHLQRWALDVGLMSAGETRLPVSLETALQRFIFILQGLSEPAKDLRVWSLASAALLAQSIWVFEDTPQSRQYAYELARCLAGLADQTLLVMPAAQDTLWETAKSDSPEAPAVTHQWLRRSIYNARA